MTMATRWRSTGLTLPLLLLAVFLAGCSLFGSGTHKHSSVTDGERPHINPPGSDSELEAHLANQLIIRVDQGTSPERIAADLGGAIVDTLPSLNAALLQLPKNVQVVDAMRRLQDDTAVRYAEPNYRVYGAPTGFGAVDGGFSEFPMDGIDAFGPADTFAAHPSAAHPHVNPRQWGMHTVGARDAWEHSTGAGVVIAVLDTGIDERHPDIGTSKVVGRFNTLQGDLPDDTDDRQGHGTHVAGIAAGYPGGPDGIVGVAYNSNLLAVKVLNDDGFSDAFSVAKGIMAVVGWSDDHPHTRVVINMSLGSSYYNMLQKDAVDRALEKGIVVVAAMGNDSRGRLAFPAGLPGVIAVGASRPGFRPASFSTSWKHISVSAPGVDIYSAYPVANGAYFTGSGTSQATPFVAGAAALLLAHDNGLTPGQVRSRLEAFAFHPGGPDKRDEQLGHGVIDIPRSLMGASDIDFYGAVVVKLVDHENDPITTTKYGTPPALYLSDFVIDVRLEHPSRPEVGPIRANSEGLAVFRHVRADPQPYRVVAFARSIYSSLAPKVVSLEGIHVDRGQDRQVTLQIDLRDIVP